MKYVYGIELYRNDTWNLLISIYRFFLKKKKKKVKTRWNAYKFRNNFQKLNLIFIKSIFIKFQIIIPNFVNNSIYHNTSSPLSLSQVIGVGHLWPKPSLDTIFYSQSHPNSSFSVFFSSFNFHFYKFCSQFPIFLSS